MPDKLNAPPTGYHEVPAPGAAQSKPPAGYHEVAAPGAPTTTASTTPAPQNESESELSAYAPFVGGIRRFAGGAADEARGMWAGAKQATTAPPEGGIEKALQVFDRITGAPTLASKRMLIDPTIGKADSTYNALKSGEYIKGALGAFATVNPFAPDVTKLYEQSASGDVAGAAGHGAFQIATLKGIEAAKGAAKLLERAPTIEQGKIGYVNRARQSTDILDNAVRNTGVGARANQVIAADATDLARTQSPGAVNGMAATVAMQNVMNQTRMGGVAHGFPAQMTLADAKATMTQLGREASRLDRTGKAPEAAATWAAYDAFRDETLKRAQDLDRLQPGAGHAQAWGDYAKEFRNYMDLHKGVLGHLVEGEHTGALNKLIEHSGQLPELGKWFKKYGVDFSAIEDAAKQGKTLNDLSKQTSNLFMGKIRAIYKYPLTAGAAVTGSVVVGHAIGGMLGGIVLPLLVAGRVAGLLDRVQIHNILLDLSKKIPPDMMQISGDPLGPHNATYGPIGPGAPGAPTTPTGPTGGGPAPTVPAGGGAAATPPGAGGVPRANIPPASTTGATPPVERRVATGPYEGTDRRMRTSTGEPLYENTHREAEQRWEDIQAERAAEVAKSRKAKSSISQPTGTAAATNENPVQTATRAMRVLQPEGRTGLNAVVDKVMHDAGIERVDAIKAISQAVKESKGVITGGAGKAADLAKNRADIIRGLKGLT